MNVTTNKPMETMTQPKLTGYRQLSAEDAALINEAKALAEQCGEFIERLRRHPHANDKQASAAADSLVPLDHRWVSIGATHLQQGFMAVIRGIAQPTTF